MMKTRFLSMMVLMLLFTFTSVKAQEMTTNNDFSDVKIELKDGEKWPVDKPMMTHIQNIKNDVLQFNGTSLEDYNQLAKEIDENLSLLTSNCTMTGKGHDELHKWLLPFLDISDAFMKSKTLDQARENYHIIRDSFVLVDNNFK